MPEELVQETEESNGQENEGEKPQLSYEELQAELAKVRREAAGKRVKNNELESELEAFRKWKESQMTEVEKAQSRLAALESERVADYREIAQTKFGLDAEDMEFIHGSTKEEILASAEKYSARVGKRDTQESGGNPNLFPGTRGTPVGSRAADPNEHLRALLQGR